MRSEHYRRFFTAEYLMGPNSIRLLDELLRVHPLMLPAEGRILDLGCGKGITSLFAAAETGATVYAADLWIPEAENRTRFARWSMADKLIPLHADAHALPFAQEMFDAVISIDSYHYFGGQEEFFAAKLLPLIKRGGVALIAMPGLKAGFHGRSEELLTPWLGDEACMFRSAVDWKRLIGSNAQIRSVHTWEMSCFEPAWQEWFATGHEYALSDLRHFDSLIRPYTAFIGIIVLKQ